MNENRSIIDIAQAAKKEQQGVPEAQTSRVQTDNSQADALKELLKKVDSKIAWVDLELPSRGLLSDGDNVTVQIRPFTFEDEKILRTVKNANQAADVIKVLIQRAVKGLNYDKLTLADKTYLIFKLREISYGNEYDIELECPKCQAKNGLRVELNKLPIKYLEQEEVSNNKVTLPDSEVEVEFRYPMADDDSNMTDMGNLMDGLWKFVKSVGGHDSRMVIQQFISRTTGKDVLTLQNRIFGIDYGLQTKVNFICNSCQNDSALELPLNESFFNVS
tara:strand:- start:26 stop:850 length:825 start_codon:yes stop_codon:yes gene_type:complete